MGSLQQLVKKDMALYAENPLTKEHITSIKLENISAEFEGKAYYLNIAGKDFQFEVNEADNNFLTLVLESENITEEDIKNAEVKIQK